MEKRPVGFWILILFLGISIISSINVFFENTQIFNEFVSHDIFLMVFILLTLTGIIGAFLFFNLSKPAIIWVPAYWFGQAFATGYLIISAFEMMLYDLNAPELILIFVILTVLPSIILGVASIIYINKAKSPNGKNLFLS